MLLIWLKYFVNLKLIHTLFRTVIIFRPTLSVVVIDLIFKQSDNNTLTNRTVELSTSGLHRHLYIL